MVFQLIHLHVGDIEGIAVDVDVCWLFMLHLLLESGLFGELMCGGVE